MALSAESVAPPDAPSVVVRGVLFIIATSKLQHFLIQVVVFFPSHSSPSFRRIAIALVQRF
jgi:hypothetical protein